LLGAAKFCQFLSAKMPMIITVTTRAAYGLIAVLASNDQQSTASGPVNGPVGDGDGTSSQMFFS
jgi:hypothetical protein